MGSANDSTIETLARVITAVVRHEVPEAVLHDRVDEIMRTAEARAANILRQTNGAWGPAKARYDDLHAAAWALNRLLDEFPARPLHDARFTCDPATIEDLCRAAAALSAANTLIAKAARREGYRGGDMQS